MMRQFQRTIEDFVCEACGADVAGNGYRNHCPQCLVSKHVDVFPGDRAAGCGGLMDVDAVEMNHGKYVLVHRCRACGHIKKNKLQDDDSVDILIRLMKSKNS